VDAEKKQQKTKWEIWELYFSFIAFENQNFAFGFA